MKRSILILTSFITYNLIQSIIAHPTRETPFYYGKDGIKIHLRQNFEKRYVVFKEDLNTNFLKEFSPKDKDSEIKGPLLSPSYRHTSSQRWVIFENIKFETRLSQITPNTIVYETPFFKTNDNQSIGISQFLYVKLKGLKDLALLENQAEENDIKIVGKNNFMDQWHTLECSKNSSGNSLEVANRLHETGLFEACEPDFLVTYRGSCVNDEYFDRQWGLKNVGQDGGSINTDIKICDAWKHTQGNQNVIVAVIDDGIDLQHPDFLHLSSLSYDADTSSSPSQVRGSHGTACAGIIAAQADNQIGVAGIAPKTTLVSVSCSLGLGPMKNRRLADSINWAWKVGKADVISNSWESDGPSSMMIDDAIEAALTSGRNKKGCVIVFAAGNNNGDVAYPANSRKEILAVGAMSPCARRKKPDSCDGEPWGSSYGSEIDLVAPGVRIPTTDRVGALGYGDGDYHLYFHGTSAACPHVAGAAALVLAINPNLKGTEVNTLLEQTASKVGNYRYRDTQTRPHGGWNSETGYGLLNVSHCAEAAMKTISDQ